MGAAYELLCESCGYQSQMTYLGRSRNALQEHVLGTCHSCNGLTSMVSEQHGDDCVLCEAVDRVTATPTRRAPKIFGVFRRDSDPRYQCPKCKSFSVELPDTPSMFVD